MTAEEEAQEFLKNLKRDDADDLKQRILKKVEWDIRKENKYDEEISHLI